MESKHVIPPPRRPRVICHMAASVDGRIVVDGWPAADEVTRQYEAVHAEYAPDGWLCGRVTMEPFARRLRSDEEVARQHTGGSREDFVAPAAHGPFAFALDPSGRLEWPSGDLDGDHVVAILTERVSDEHLAALRERGVSYVLAGAGEADLPLALEKVAGLFGVRTLMLEGGGRINGAMLSAGLIDEVSLLVAPVADGRIGTPTLFDSDHVAPRRLTLKTVERRAGDILWLRYSVESSSH
ncbi:MAG TPA: dihydrofolate reductase family protein [Rhodothermales bacterium]|nr:dihydrofolate reductase family protein [Rhodothermales bacterium]